MKFHFIGKEDQLIQMLENRMKILNLVNYLFDNFISNSTVFSTFLESGVIWVNKLTKPLLCQ